MNTSQHPPREQLVAFGQGRLDTEIAQSIAEHVADCDSCCDVLGDIPSDTLADQVRAADADTTIDLRSGKSISQPAVDRFEVPQDLVDHSRYRVVRVLGAGGMGTVFQAEHRVMDRPVALKVINRELTNDPEVVERFRQEVRAAAKLSHPNIVTAHDAEQTGELHFLVMEYVEGVDLARYVKRKGPLAPGLTAHIGRQVAQGLQHAAQAGMVHRDIKPQNLIITKSGRVRILDFGLARLGRKEHERDSSKDDDEQLRRSATALTLAGSVLGTPDYIAPEQATDSRNADIRADIYSLGCTLYFLLTGRPPFPGGSVLSKLLAHQKKTATPIGEVRDDVPEDLIGIVDRMMARNPQDRFSTPGDVAKALQPVAQRWLKSEQNAKTLVQEAEAAIVSTEAQKTPPQATTNEPTIPDVSGSLRSLTGNRRHQVFVAVGVLMACLAGLGYWFSSDETNSVPSVPSVPTQAAAVEGLGLSDRLIRLQLPANGRAVELKMLVVPSGRLLMGSSESDLEKLGRHFDQTTIDNLARAESPTIGVSIPSSFLMSETEITVGQFRVFVEAERHQTNAERDATGWGVFQGDWRQDKNLEGRQGFCWHDFGEFQVDDSYPAANISWNDAIAFCRWLSRQKLELNGRLLRFRLPVEAEWEYACRASSETLWPFGDDPSELGDYAVLSENAGNRPAPAGQQKANAFGLKGMLGNESEWCLDVYAQYSSLPRQLVIDSEFVRRISQGLDGSPCVKRGGSFNMSELEARPAWREAAPPDSPTRGAFRVVAEFAD